MLMQGTQNISKFKDSATNTVQINMALLRLPQFQTDILLTFNNPTVIRWVLSYEVCCFLIHSIKPIVNYTAIIGAMKQWKLGAFQSLQS